MANLAQETIAKLIEHNKAKSDVSFVTDGNHYCSFEDFLAAADFEYDDGFGGAEIQETLKVVGDDWWLERHEYDGSEWWEFKTTPKRPKVPGSVCIKSSIFGKSTAF